MIASWSLCLSALWLAVPQAVYAQDRTIQISIPAQPLGEALIAVAHRYSLQLAYSPDLLRGLRSSSVSGNLSVEQALQRVLTNTPISYRLNGRNVVLLKRPEPRVNAAPRAAQVLAPIVATASRSDIEPENAPQKIVIIEPEQIEQQLAISSNSSNVLSNLLPAYTPSRDKMNGSGETLRGRTPLIMIDGVPQSNPLRPTGREVHTIDYSMVDHIEVINGASASNGIGGTGGVINIITKSPEPGTLNQHFGIQATTPTSQLKSETMSYKTDYGVNGREGPWEYLLAGSFESQGLALDGWNNPVGADNTQGDLMSSRAYNILAKLGYWIDDNQKLQLSLNHYKIKGRMDYIGIAGDREAGIPTTSERGDPEGVAPHNEVWTSALKYENSNLADTGIKLDAMVFNQRFEGLFGADNSKTFQDPSIAPVGQLYDQSRATADKWGTKLSLTKDDLFDGRLKLTAGFDTLMDKGKQDLYLTGRTYVPESKYTSYAPFVMAEFKLLDNLTLSAGYRYEMGQLDVTSYRTLAAYNNAAVQGGKLKFNEGLFSGGLVYKPLDNLTFFGSFSQGFDMPDVGRALRSINSEGQSIENFQALKPILTDNYEVGMRYRNDRFDMDLSLYQSNSKYGNRVVPVNGQFQLARQKTRVQGLEAGLGVQINDKHHARIGYSYMRGKYDSDDDGSLDAKLGALNVAPNRIVASWSAKWTDKLSSFLQVNYAFSQKFEEQDSNFNGYALVDLALNYKLPKGTVSLSASNLLNKKYITYYSQSALVEPLRYFAGRGRTVTLGYSVNF